MARTSPRLLASCLLGTIFAFSLPVQAQEPSAPATETASPPPSRDPLGALASLQDAIGVVERRIEALTSRLGDISAAEREIIEAELKDLTARRGTLRADFESIATGVDPGEYEGAPAKDFEIKDEINGLLQPIVDELKKLTERPREIEQYRNELSVWERRRDTASRALANLDALPATGDAELATALDAVRAAWSEKEHLATSRIEAISYQLSLAESEQPSFYETVRDGTRDFFRTRGLNLLLCIAVFLGTFLGLRFLHRHLQRRASWMRRSTRPFYVRLIDVGLDLFSLLGAIAATLFTLYATGDWVLMGLAIIVLIGLILAARTGLPKIYDDAKLILNIGEVREGERIVFDGVPWRIDSLGFYTLLKNDRLRGGVLRLPVRRLAGMYSRTTADHEWWFPTEEGDWIHHPELGHARVASQTPEWVHLVKLGGARITRPTAEFLESGATNLSHGFRLTTTLGIDYRHIAEATAEIPATLQSELSNGIGEFLGERGRLICLRVEFAGAAASSLDLEIIADFDGAAAACHAQLRRALQRHAVECCHRHGWAIPFPQIVVHEGALVSASA